MGEGSRMSTSRYQLTPDLMPKTLREVVDYCGMDVALALVAEFPGARLWIPTVWRLNHELTARLGEKAARSLIDNFGSSLLEVPRSVLTPAGRQRVIRQLAADDMPRREIARQLGITQHQVEVLLRGDDISPSSPGRRRKVDPRQIDIDDLLK